MPLEAILLAAGRGSRLGDLTGAVPKPMLTVRGKPILEHNIEWLRGWGIKRLFINLHHLPEAIRGYFGEGGQWGVDIRYSYEPVLLGTAGAVRKILEDYRPGVSEKPGAAGPFLVVYGDNYFEFDLGDFLEAYERKKAALVAFVETEDVRQSGIAQLGPDGRILRFIEKPRPGEIVSHLVNAGVYVLEARVLGHIPAGRPVDFGRDVFPEMIRNGEAIYGHVVKGSLTAVDTPELFGRAAGKGGIP